MNDVPEKDRDIAMVFQNYALYPHMTVAQNIGFSLKLSKRPRKEIRERVRETARLLAIESLLDRRPKQLSGGQRQQAMGRAVIRQPQVFLMDEPLSNLDAKLRADARRDRGAPEAPRRHHRVRHARPSGGDDDGRPRRRPSRRAPAAGRHADERLRPACEPVRRRFIGSPEMNLAQTTIERRDAGLAFSLGDSDIPVSAEVAAARGLDAWVGKELVVGIRLKTCASVRPRRTAVDRPCGAPWSAWKPSARTCSRTFLSMPRRRRPAASPQS